MRLVRIAARLHNSCTIIDQRVRGGGIDPARGWSRLAAMEKITQAAVLRVGPRAPQTARPETSSERRPPRRSEPAPLVVRSRRRFDDVF